MVLTPFPSALCRLNVPQAPADHLPRHLPGCRRVSGAVYQLFQDAKTGAGVRSVTVTAGHAAQVDARGECLVPKKDLAGTPHVLLHA